MIYISSCVHTTSTRLSVHRLGEKVSAMYTIRGHLWLNLMMVFGCGGEGGSAESLSLLTAIDLVRC